VDIARCPTRLGLDRARRKMYEEVPAEVGAALRRARTSRGLTLRDAARAGAGGLKPTTLASYERGERSLSVERFFRIAALYDISPARIVADVHRRIERRAPIRVDVSKIRDLEGAEAGILDGFVRNVVALRNQPTSDIVHLREGDIEVLATATGRRVTEFVRAVAPALRDEPGRPASSGGSDDGS